MDVLKTDKQFIERQEEILTTHLKSLQHDALRIYEEITGNNSLHSFHARIGMHNNTFVDSVRTRFVDPNDFINRWVSGLLARVESEARRSGGKPSQETLTSGIFYLLQILNDELLREYAFTFLTRNFYRNYKERVRAKPDESLWSIWFGNGTLVWGLLISPSLRKNEWTNDKSEMRREEYNYWTVRHVMEAGLIDPESEDPIVFKATKDFSIFYRSVLKRVSNSKYEREISDLYIDYLHKSKNPLDEPFLIPELRYAGKDKEHKYRLDFSVFNPYSMKMTGFEISPSYSHMSVKGIKGKTQKSVNEDLSKKWDREMGKRNEYFSKYGLSTVTFTDENLSDIDSCFLQIKMALSERQSEAQNLSSTIDDLESLLFRMDL